MNEVKTFKCIRCLNVFIAYLVKADDELELLSEMYCPICGQSLKMEVTSQTKGKKTKGRKR